MDKLAFSGSGDSGSTGDDQRTTEMKIQDEIAGNDVLFKQGLTFEWVKNKIAIALEVRYQDLLIFYNGKRIPEPFCLIDLGVKTGETIEVQIAEGAVVGLDAVRKQVEQELQDSQ
ncbi:UNKNOWN [Stylonychia lemnae]|uniref:Ubiquitin-like domain-containing protein n=1 Tax=Stylonychia lemnae TaxID=5949 RepID=A0A078A813_STYLE|nr:UNKNOWN [Stylonychia lemnae]|eukprot:CDW76911.1 UNKNOWN [Stylonychia lemnae]